MLRRSILISSIAVLTVLFLAACASKATTTASSTTAAESGTAAASSTASDSAELDLAARSDSAGSVAVNVKPASLAVGRMIAFDITMNTHSVDLSDDMVRASLLRDDTGIEHTPTEWDGSGPGGHHRSGTLVFGALTGKPRFVELVIRGVAQVPERVFRWDLTQ